MKRLCQLKGPARRRCMKLARLVRKRGVVYVRTEAEFRDTFRLHRAGVITAVVSKRDLLGRWARAGKKWAFKELALFASEGEALTQYRTTLSRSGSLFG